MSASEIDNFILLFPNVEWDPDAEVTPVQLPSNISYTERLTENLQTLSTNSADPSGIIQGFLYVPDLDPSDPCVNISRQYLPTNVTRQANLSPSDFTLIALAPWINAECTQGYLAAARLDPARAFIFYLPDNSTTQPPAISSSAWGLNDGGQWKSQNHYPVYAVPGSVGSHMMSKLGLYSGNLTDVPYGHDVSELPGVDPRDYVRVYTEIGVSIPSSLPSLWVFLLIIAGALGLMLAITSGSMHFIQRRCRESLRRRVVSGEADLEALGIKRLTVPQEIIHRMPIFTYNCEDEQLPSAPIITKNTDKNPTVVHEDATEGSTTNDRSTPAQIILVQDSALSSTEANISNDQHPVSMSDNHSNPDSILTHKFLPYSQPTCPICLDDFESGVTAIRELPCGHIFHPDCIDSFLSNNSSLCPMCKKSVLPIGYCPALITNNMVRRERMVRSLRSRVTIQDNETDIDGGQNWGFSARRRIFSPPTGERQTQQMANAVALQPQITSRADEIPNQVSPGLSREEIAQQRIRELAAGPVTVEDIYMAHEARRPKWRRALAKAFPGFS